MSDPIIYKGRGTPEMYDDLMDFLNYVFGFNGNENDFKKLLLKCYKEKYDPCFNNYVVTENGKLKAAIGAYNSVLKIGDTELLCRGIGNVGVHPYSRSKGYMSDCMNMALRDMINDGVAISNLDGKRQRYNYFGYDKCAPAYSFDITSNNMRHCFRDVPFTELEFYEVKDEDTDLIDKMYDLYTARPMHTCRPRDQFLDICRSWRSPANAILKNGEFIGYFIANLHELTLIDNKDLYDVVRNYIRKNGDVHVSVAAWDSAIYAPLMEIAESFSCVPSEFYNILDYKKVVTALFKFMASYTTLADGEITVKVHGYARDESLMIYVENGVPYVEEYSGECDFELEHREAMMFFFGIYSPRWKELAPEIRSWFPLPLYTDRADQV